MINTQQFEICSLLGYYAA